MPANAVEAAFDALTWVVVVGRQGIRVYSAPNVLVYGNVLFRNENCGVYFAAASTNGWAIGNTCYENIKGVRWSSQSVDGLCLDNTLFENHERGIAIENADRVFLRRVGALRNLLQGNVTKIGLKPSEPSLPNINWGYGKLDLAAIDRMLAALDSQ